MLWTWMATLAGAGQLIEVRPGDGDGVFDVVGRTDADGGEIVNWYGRPLELLILADMSVSVVLDPEGPAREMQTAMLTAARTMREHPLPGDGLGVTVFGGNAQPWVPLGPLDRPGLDAWLAAFGPAEHAPLSYSSVEALKPGEWREQPMLPSTLALDAFDTDPSEGFRSALDVFRRSDKPLKAIVVLWDGEQTTESAVRGLLNRLWNHEIHVFTIAVGEVTPEGLTARGGGDVYLARGAAHLAMRRIIGQLRMPEP